MGPSTVLKSWYIDLMLSSWSSVSAVASSVTLWPSLMMSLAWWSLSVMDSLHLETIKQVTSSLRARESLMMPLHSQNFMSMTWDLCTMTSALCLGPLNRSLKSLKQSWREQWSSCPSIDPLLTLSTLDHTISDDTWETSTSSVQNDHKESVLSGIAKLAGLPDDQIFEPKEYTIQFTKGLNDEFKCTKERSY